MTPASNTTPASEPAIEGQQTLPEGVASACGSLEPGPVCRWVYDATGGNEVLAGLARQVVPGFLKIVLIVGVAWVANRLLKRAITRFTRGLANEGIAKLTVLRQRAPLHSTGPIDLSRATMRAETIASVLTSIASFTIWAIAAVMVLGVFAINLGPLIAGAGIIGIALGFGAQNLVKDFLSGLFMLMEDQYGIGDIVDVGEATGTIEGITLRTTRLRDVEGTVWHIPNGQITRIGNKSQLWARSLLDVGVAYETDIVHAKTVIKRVADDMWHDPTWSSQILDEPEVWGIENFGPNEIVIRLVVKVVPAQQWKVNRELRERLKAAFDAEGIEIPYPQRMLWVRNEDNGALPTATEPPAAAPSRNVAETDG